MIIALEEAKKINTDVTQEDLNGIETMIRTLTDNNFQNVQVRIKGLTFHENKVISSDDLFGFKKGQTVQISKSIYSDGLYVIEEVLSNGLKLKDAKFLQYSLADSFLTLVSYPDDILVGVKKLLKYDAKMADKVGVKSETISRWSVTYYDQNSNENVNGYPSSLMSFINKYNKIRW